MIHRHSAAGIAIMVAIVLLGCNRAPSGSTPVPGPGHTGHLSGGDPHAGHQQSFSKLVVRTESAPQAGSETKLALRVEDANSVTVKDLEVVHDQKAHLIVVTKGLDQFAHVHPAIHADGSMSITHRFPVGGQYWLYLDYKPTGKAQATASAKLHVGGQTIATPELRPNVPGSVEIDGLKAAISIAAGASGAKRIVFTLTDSMGRPVTNLEPYMGAMGHLVVISVDGKEYVHAHMEGVKADSGVVTFEAHFMRQGLYKGWGQFQRGGQVQVVPFVVRID